MRNLLNKKDTEKSNNLVFPNTIANPRTRKKTPDVRNFKFLYSDYISFYFVL